MCIMWMPANLLSQGIVDKNDKICFKKENKNTKVNEESKDAAFEMKAKEEQPEKV